MNHTGAAWLPAAVLLLSAAGSDHAPPGTVSMSPQQQHAMGLATTTAEQQAILQPVQVPGTIAFDPDHVAVLRPLAPERVTQLLAQPGQAVHAGQVLATVDIPSLVTAEDSLAAARAAAVEGQTAVAVSRESLRRGEILARDGSLAKAEAERRRLVLAQSTAALDANRSRAAALQAEVSRLSPDGSAGAARIVSPIDGVVANVGITPGEFLDAGTSSFTVADLSVVMALAQVPEDSAALVAVGDPVRVTLPGRSWNGRVASLGAELDPRSRTLPARVVLDNADSSLRAGMAVTMVITSHRKRDGVVVPAGAVQFVGDKRVAFTPAGGDRFESHELTLGVQQPDWIEVTHGLSPGDTVVTKGSFELKALLQERMLGNGG